MNPSCRLYLIRHAEKQPITGDRDPPLSAAGSARADALALQLANQPIQRLFASQFQRTQATLQPLARQLGLTIEPYDAGQSAAFVSALLASRCDGAMIIAGHSNTLPAMLRAAGVDEPATEFDEGRYGDLFIIDRRRMADGWQVTLQQQKFGN